MVNMTYELEQLIKRGFKKLSVEAEDFDIYKFNEEIFYIHVLANTEDEDGELIETFVFFNKDERDEELEEARDFLDYIDFLIQFNMTEKLEKVLNRF
jgi:hypothetical protein